MTHFSHSCSALRENGRFYRSYHRLSSLGRSHLFRFIVSLMTSSSVSEIDDPRSHKALHPSLSLPKAKCSPFHFPERALPSRQNGSPLYDCNELKCRQLYLPYRDYIIIGSVGAADLISSKVIPREGCALLALSWNGS